MNQLTLKSEEEGRRVFSTFKGESAMLVHEPSSTSANLPMGHDALATSRPNASEAMALVSSK